MARVAEEHAHETGPQISTCVGKSRLIALFSLTCRRLTHLLAVASPARREIQHIYGLFCFHRMWKLQAHDQREGLKHFTEQPTTPSQLRL
jgi:hypothetical protein